MSRPSFFLLLLLSSAGFACAGCNAQVATVLASDDDAGTVTPTPTPGDVDRDGGADPDAATNDCESGGGVCLPAGESAPPSSATSNAPCSGTDRCWVPVAQPTAPVCVQDVDCNATPVATILGACFRGVCICNKGSHVQPNGKCGPTPPPDCAAHGGTCRQEPATCAAGELQGAQDTNVSCGDFVGAVCCLNATSCKAPIDLVCCGASTAPYEPICVNGWKTCGVAAPTPAERQAGCF